MARKLPFNVNAEKTVLGAMLVNEMSLAACIGVLTEEHFYAHGKRHQLIYNAILSLVNKHIPVDMQTVTEELLNNKDLDEIGGVDYLLELTQSVVSYSNMEFYIRILQDQMVLRQLLNALEKINSEYDNEEIDDISDFVARADGEIRKVTLRRRISNFVSAEEVTKTIEAELKIVSREDGLTGIDTGYQQLNYFTHGFQKGDMIILAARPSVGKTALALNIGYSASRKTQQPVAFFSLEMPATALVKRLIAADSCIDLDKIHSAGKFLTGKDRAAIAQAIKNVGSTNLFIDDTPGIKLIDIIAKARQLKGRYDNLGLIIIDYIGLITTGEKRIESRQVEVSNISRQLKELARELKIPVLVVSQLSREVDRRDNRKPMLSDLRESGSIEQDADQVLLMYRANYYKGLGSSKRGERSDEAKEKIKQEEVLVKAAYEEAELVELRIAKNRNGRTGMVNLIFFTSHGRFDTPSDDFIRNLRAIREDHSGGDIED